VSDPVWRLEGPVGELGRKAVRYFRAPDREQAAAAFGLRPEEVRIQRVGSGEKIGPQERARRRK
jgi:hypothetical protein